MGTERTSGYKMSLNLLVNGLQLGEPCSRLFSYLLRGAPHPLRPLQGPRPLQGKASTEGECHTLDLMLCWKWGCARCVLTQCLQGTCTAWFSRSLTPTITRPSFLNRWQRNFSRETLSDCDLRSLSKQVLSWDLNFGLLDSEPVSLTAWGCLWKEIFSIVYVWKIKYFLQTFQ